MSFLDISPNVFGTSLTWYSVFILIGALVTYVISDYFYKKNPESKKCPDLMLNTLLLAFPAGLIGARIWYVLSEWDYYFNSPIEILKVWEGGLAIQGGVMLGVLVGSWYVVQKCRRLGMNLKLTTLMDYIIPNILIAQVIGRWGNFFNREVYGACVDHVYALKNWWMLPNWLVNNMAGGAVSGEYIACSVNQYAQPLFLYEGILNFVGFILISIVIRKLFTKRVDGTLSALYLVWYGVVRACLEGTRNEMFIMRWGNLSQSLITSIAFVVAGVAFIVYLYIRNYQNNKKVIVYETKIEVKENVEDAKKVETIVTDAKIVETLKEEIKEEEKEKITSKSKPIKSNASKIKTTTKSKATSTKSTITKTTKSTTTTKSTSTKKTTPKKVVK